jgi:hypothetical protein
MGTGYTRADTGNNIADGNIINAADLDGEFDAVQAAFDASTGHTHDGTTAEGAPIAVTGPTQEYVSTATELRPKTNNTYDLGSATNQWKDLYVDGTANLDAVDIDGGNIDGTVVGATTPAAGTFTTAAATTGNITTVNATTVDTTNIEVTNLKAKDGTASATIANSTGVMTVVSLVATTADINGGTIDGAIIGGSTPAAGTFTTTAATTGNITTVNATTVDTTNLEVTSLKAKDGTAAGSIADSTGVVTLASSVLTTTDINGGTIDGVTIGGAVAGAITGTTGTFSGDLSLADKIVHTGDTNTAIRFPADDTVTVETAGSERMRVTSTGNVGIGTSSPSDRLSVNSKIGFPNQGGLNFRNGDSLTLGDIEFPELTTGAANIRFFRATNTTGVKRVIFHRGDLSATIDVQIGVDGTNTYFNSGNVGIGTTTPGSKLDVAGDITIADKIIHSGDTDTAIRFPANDTVTVETANSERMRITSTGDVGIGTSNPQRKLHIADTAPTIVFQETDQATDESRWRVYMGNSDFLVDTINDAFSAAEPAYKIIRGDGIAVSAHTWSTANSERMRITSTGNVGINESAPDYKLDVNGTFGFSPGASVTPVDNGDVVFELTNNTTLTVKAKGSDGVVRSGTILLV